MTSDSIGLVKDALRVALVKLERLEEKRRAWKRIDSDRISIISATAGMTPLLIAFADCILECTYSASHTRTNFYSPIAHDTTLILVCNAEAENFILLTCNGHRKMGLQILLLFSVHDCWFSLVLHRNRMFDHSYLLLPSSVLLLRSCTGT